MEAAAGTSEPQQTILHDGKDALNEDRPCTAIVDDPSGTDGAVAQSMTASPSEPGAEAESGPSKTPALDAGAEDGGYGMPAPSDMDARTCISRPSSVGYQTPDPPVGNDTPSEEEPILQPCLPKQISVRSRLFSEQGSRRRQVVPTQVCGRSYARYTGPRSRQSAVSVCESLLLLMNHAGATAAHNEEGGEHVRPLGLCLGRRHHELAH